MFCHDILSKRYDSTHATIRVHLILPYEYYVCVIQIPLTHHHRYISTRRLNLQFDVAVSLLGVYNKNGFSENRVFKGRNSTRQDGKNVFTFWLVGNISFRLVYISIHVVDN